MMYKYGLDAPDADSKAAGAAFERAMLANANRGGENVATGAVVGALLGASVGFSRMPAWMVDGLAPAHRAAIDQEIDAFLAASPLVAENPASL